MCDYIMFWMVDTWFCWFCLNYTNAPWIQILAKLPIASLFLAMLSIVPLYLLYTSWLLLVLLLLLFVFYMHTHTHTHIHIYHDQISALSGQTIILEVKMCAGQAYGQLPEVIAVIFMPGNGPGGKKWNKAEFGTEDGMLVSSILSGK